jgi:hypothetical protein
LLDKQVKQCYSSKSATIISSPYIYYYGPSQYEGNINGIKVHWQGIGKTTLQDQATLLQVNRTPIDSSRITKFLEDAAKLTEILKIKDYGDIIRKV